jgi:hypothetical protein
MRFAQLSCGSQRPAKYGGAFAPIQKPLSRLLDFQQVHRFLDHPQVLPGARNDDALVNPAQADAAMFASCPCRLLTSVTLYWLVSAMMG